MKQVIDRFRGEYEFLSNFYRKPYIYRSRFGNVFVPTAEHAFQAEKAQTRDDFFDIVRAGSAQDAKRAGRMVMIRADWETRKHKVMQSAVFDKFRDKEMRKHLLNTGDALLIEGNSWHDNYWGDCHCGREDCLIMGSNMLGKTLMEVRQRWAWYEHKTCGGYR